MTVPFSERSAGFIWFFSFLVKFAQVSKRGGNQILLLDEPGLTLHGKAQADLLRYFADRLLPKHQVVFSTHSPFMVPPDDLTLSRIIEDQVEQKRPGFWTTKGTKVRGDVLATDPDTLFPSRPPWATTSPRRCSSASTPCWSRDRATSCSSRPCRLS
ncbi:hypothetical protein GCM10025880_10980 [Methylorubrum aminovorans]|uniref:AAA family ATPase n=1 Tax=Methylorubrum aminovorans TaxID=269069 RepID=UPI0023E92374|nr:AAA family ATPase [Methylorubrum aminovorans]GMA74681.1 hypothetical protein GCM10025880_10980 [Methylorubrum aminovorans]